MNGSKCPETIWADSKADLLTAALNHALAAHHMPETRGLRDLYRGKMKRGAPPV